MTDKQQQPDLAIIGGGITGLAAAYEAVKRGQTNIHVYEASNRLGGKIQSGQVNGVTINRGAEFIDSEHEQLIKLANELGVNLIENTGMAREEFVCPNGNIMAADEFYTAYKPYAEQIIRDREEMARNPNGQLAQLLGKLTLDQYAAMLDQQVAPAPRSFWQALTDTLSFRGNPAKEVLGMAAHSYASEVGQPIGNISATQFMAETSSTPDTFLSSDCKWRVEGGTEQLIIKLREALAAKGVQFHTGAELNHVAKQADGKLALSFNGASHNTHTSKTMITLPAYALAKVQGLEALGMSPESQALIRETQYTNSYKLTIAFKPGMQPPEGAFYSPNGFQCWSPAPGLLTILSTAEQIGVSKSPKQQISEQLEAFAKAHGSTIYAMFDVKNMNYNNPGGAGCYATPKPGQVQALEKLSAELPAMAANGLGIAGTFMPLDGCVGFMECGVVSAQKSCDLLVGPAKEAGDVQHRAPEKQWAPEIAAQRAANDNAQAIAAAR
jgi:monoamine oxidase